MSKVNSSTEPLRGITRIKLGVEESSEVTGENCSKYLQLGVGSVRVFKRIFSECYLVWQWHGTQDIEGFSLLLTQKRWYNYLSILQF